MVIAVVTTSTSTPLHISTCTQVLRPICLFVWVHALPLHTTRAMDSQVVSLHCNLDKATHHLMNKSRLEMMKPDAVLVNAARGPVIDEVALVAHLKANPDFRVGLDVFEDEPAMKPDLEKMPNAVIVPHIASASMWTRSGMVSAPWVYTNSDEQQPHNVYCLYIFLWLQLVMPAAPGPAARCRGCRMLQEYSR